MFDLLLILTGIAIAASAIHSYRRSGDTLAPAIVFAPMLAYIYVYSPWTLNRAGELENWLTSAQLVHVQTINLIGVGMFCVGLCALRPPAETRASAWGLASLGSDPAIRRLLFRTAIFLGLLAVGSYAFLLYRAGGPMAVYSRGKAYVGSPSGYVSEMQMLAYPALLLLAVAWHGEKLTVGRFMTALLIASPHLMTATLGGRRGPAFLICSTLALCWFIVRDKRPSIRVVVGGVALLGLLMLFLVTNRRNIHLGSEFDFDTDAFMSSVKGEGASEGTEFIYASGRILVAEYHGRFNWGTYYLITVFVRPIPKFLWPTKWNAVGMGGATPGMAGFSEDEWREAVGFDALAGSSGSFIADLFCSFWWLSPLAVYLLGRLYAASWNRSRKVGGVWTIVYMEMLCLSVYLPSQSIGAWLHRIILLAVPTLLIWRYVVAPLMTRRGGHQATAELATLGYPVRG